jgi:hypothetical protein
VAAAGSASTARPTASRAVSRVRGPMWVRVEQQACEGRAWHWSKGLHRCRCCCCASCCRMLRRALRRSVRSSARARRADRAGAGSRLAGTRPEQQAASGMGVCIPGTEAAETSGYAVIDQAVSYECYRISGLSIEN